VVDMALRSGDARRENRCADRRWRPADASASYNRMTTNDSHPDNDSGHDARIGDECGVCGRSFGETDIDELVCGCGAPPTGDGA
jgi:hypothetical protein